MKIKIEMDLPRWLSRLLVVGIPVAVIAIGAWVYADVPNTFKAGEVVSAKLMMANFTALHTDVESLSTSVQSLKTTTDSLSSKPQVYSAHILSTGAADNIKGNWIVSSQRNGTAYAFEYVVNLAPSVFTTFPNCTCSVPYVSGSGCNSATTCGISGTPSTTRLTLLVRDLLGNPSGYLGVCDMSLVCL